MAGADERVRGKAMATRAGARRAQAIVAAIEPDDRYSGIARRGATDVAASRSRRSISHLDHGPKLKGVVSGPDRPRALYAYSGRLGLVAAAHQSSHSRGCLSRDRGCPTGVALATSSSGRFAATSSAYRQPEVSLDRARFWPCITTPLIDDQTSIRQSTRRDAIHPQRGGAIRDHSRRAPARSGLPVASTAAHLTCNFSGSAARHVALGPAAVHVPAAAASAINLALAAAAAASLLFALVLRG